MATYSLVRLEPGSFDSNGRARIVERCGHRHRTPEAADSCSAYRGGRTWMVVDNDTDRAPEGWPDGPQHPWGD